MRVVAAEGAQVFVGMGAPFEKVRTVLRFAAKRQAGQLIRNPKHDGMTSNGASAETQPP